MNYQHYNSLKVVVEKGVAFITIDHPPINLFDDELLQQFKQIKKEISTDDEVKVIVFKSADSDFFLPHYNVEKIKKMSREHQGEIEKPNKLSEINSIFEDFRKSSKITIAQIEGRIGGGGSELVLAFDMRFAAIEKTIFQQPEVGLGVIPGAGATQRLPKLIGRSRALEVILGCQDIDAITAEKYGWVNRALPSVEINSFVEELAFRIASFPEKAIKYAKEAVSFAELPVEEGLLEERLRYMRVVINHPEASHRLHKFLEVGGQTRVGELEIERILGELGEV